MAASVPDYMLDPDAVMKDVNAAWRLKTPPDYSKTRAFYREGKLRISGNSDRRPFRLTQTR